MSHKLSKDPSCLSCRSVSATFFVSKALLYQKLQQERFFLHWEKGRYQGLVMYASSRVKKYWKKKKHQFRSCTLILHAQLWVCPITYHSKCARCPMCDLFPNVCVIDSHYDPRNLFWCTFIMIVIEKINCKLSTEQSIIWKNQ